MRATGAAAALLLAATATSACVGDVGEETVDTEGARIVGGSDAFPSEFPAVMGLYDGTHLCTATLIHPEWALTAAHCVTPALTGHTTLQEVTDSFYLILDDVDLTDQNVSSRTVRLSETIIHPDWNPTKLGDNDIAVLHLATPVSDRAPAPVYRIPVPNGTPVTQVGYGVNQPASNSGAGVLRVLNTVTADCDKYGRSDINLLCFDASDGSGTCFGDSGGPTFATVAGKLEIAGVTSFGANNECTGYDASTNVAGEIDFIDAHVPKVAGGSPQASDPAADPDIGDPPGILGGCNVEPGASRASRRPGFVALAVLGFLCILSWHYRRRRAACASEGMRSH